MGKTLVTINEAGSIQNVIMQGSTSQDVLNALLNSPSDEAGVVTNFLARTGLTLSFDTPQSSNVQRVSFDSVSNEIVFTFGDDSESRYPSTFKKFIAAMSAPSIGKLQWAYRRGEI